MISRSDLEEVVDAFSASRLRLRRRGQGLLQRLLLGVAQLVQASLEGGGVGLQKDKFFLE